MKHQKEWLQAAMMFLGIILIGDMLRIPGGTHVVFAVATTGVYIIEYIIKKKDSLNYRVGERN